MRKILIAGAGKIGTLIACLLTETNDYEVVLADLHFQGADISRLKAIRQHLSTVEIDVRDHEKMTALIKKHQFTAIISCLPYFCNIDVAKLACEQGLHYFDLTEDVSVTQAVKELSKHATTAFVPQCGLAPGFISIVANHLMSHFQQVDSVKMRVGALPINASNALQYSLTWSTDGLINEYGNPCHAIEQGENVTLPPLGSLEAIILDGVEYEAFNTSGGLGSLAELHAGKVRSMNYKTIRYPGHCKKMRLLMNDLRLNDDRDTLKRILENAVPKTYQDVVIVYSSVTGKQHGHLIEENYVNKVYPVTLAGLTWSAIQITTAAGITAVVDMVLNQPQQYRGLVYQEQFNLDEFLANRFGAYYAIN
ncbi:MAG: saccharopine dehydrogenase NADP-binding domain-containing protein [Legionellales bacterium]|nr:saccharopine dehydrogenase NADP-binding domain-containing protein [Legionellales bacterium]